MLHIAVCDDSIDELVNMERLLNQYRSSRNIHFEYAVFLSGIELISAIEKGRSFDIYCLDVIMPGYSGIDVAREIRRFDNTAPIVFFTSSKEHALESYSVKAINYVLKPVNREKFFFTFDDLLDRIRAAKEEDAVVVKSTKGIQRILISNLVFAEVIGRNVLYHLNSGKVIECTESFTAVCEAFEKYGCFIKPHRSYLVNMKYVDTIDNHQVILQTLTSIPIAQGKAKKIKQQYLAYQMETE